MSTHQETYAPEYRVVTFNGEVPENAANLLRAGGCRLLLRHDDFFCVTLEKPVEEIGRLLPNVVLNTADDLQPDSTSADPHQNLVVQAFKATLHTLANADPGSTSPTLSHDPTGAPLSHDPTVAPLPHDPTAGPLSYDPTGATATAATATLHPTSTSSTGSTSTSTGTAAAATAQVSTLHHDPDCGCSPDQTFHEPAPTRKLPAMHDMFPEAASAAPAMDNNEEKPPLPPNLRMINSGRIQVCLVDGTGDYVLPEDQKLNCTASTFLACIGLANFEPKANIYFFTNIDEVKLDIETWPGVDWPGLPDSFYWGIDAAFSRPDNGKICLIKGSSIYQMDKPSDGPDEMVPDTLSNYFKGFPTSFSNGIDAVYHDFNDGSVCFFRGDQFIRYSDIAAAPDTVNTLPITDWAPKLPEGWQSNFDAVSMQNPNDGTIIIFKGTEYIVLEDLNEAPWNYYPKPISYSFGALEDFHSGVHAAMHHDGKNYMFKGANGGGQYAVKDIQNQGQWEVNFVGLERLEAEKVWRDPALKELGYGEGTNDLSMYNYANAVWKKEPETDNAGVVFFTNWPCTWVAYAHSSLRRVVLVPGGFGAGFFPELTMHEICHLFGAVDEYKSDPDACTIDAGRFFRHPNGNSLGCTSEVEWVQGPDPIVDRYPGLPSTWTANLDAILQYSSDEVYFFQGDKCLVYQPSSDSVTVGPDPIGSLWLNMPIDFQHGIQAAMIDMEGQVFFFKGSKVAIFEPGEFMLVQVNNPQPIKDHFKGLPEDFHAEIDAAFMRDNGSTYLFKGDKYVRFSGSGPDGMDSGYPATIGKWWTGIDDSFVKDIDATLTTGGNMYFFKGGQYGKFRHGRNCLMHTNINYMCPFTRWHVGWGAFMEKIDAAVYNHHQKRMYMYSGDRYIRYSDNFPAYDANYPNHMDAYENVPDDFLHDLTAAVYWSETQSYILIKGEKCITYKEGAVSEVFPITTIFPGLKPGFYENVSAACYLKETGRYYLFSGSECAEFYTLGLLVPGYPKPMTQVWKGLPEKFTADIDAVCALPTAGFCFFKGKQFIIFPNKMLGTFGEPLMINDVFMPFPKDD